MRRSGDIVEVRVYWTFDSPRWHRATVAQVLFDGKLTVEPVSLHCSVAYVRGHICDRREFAPRDVRKPRARRTTGKIRGSGKGGWVFP